MPRGEKRAGGRPPGAKNKRTLEKEEQLSALRQIIMEHSEDLVRSQVENAKGISYLVVRAKQGGKFLRVTENMAKTTLGEGEEIIEVWEKDPSVHAFTDLMDRAFDKAKSPPQEVAIGLMDAELVAKLEQGRQRNAALKAKNG